MEVNINEKRRFLNLRQMIDQAPPFQKAALRWGARQLGAENAAELDEGLRRREMAGPETKTIRQHAYIQSLFRSSGPPQKLAIQWMAFVLRPDKLEQLDQFVANSEAVLTPSAAEGVKRSERDALGHERDRTLRANRK